MHIKPEFAVAEDKLSQDKPEREQARVLAGFERAGPYANTALASTMRRFTRSP